MNVIVVGHAKAKQGMEEKVREGLTSLGEQTRSEAGCISYDIHQAMEDKSLFLSYEVWESASAFETHMQQPYVEELLAHADELFEGPVEIKVWEKLH